MAKKNKTKVEIEISGRIHHIFHCGIKANTISNVDYNSLSNNIVSDYFKIDDDNYMRIIINDDVTNTFQIADLSLHNDQSWIWLRQWGKTTKYGKKMKDKIKPVKKFSAFSWYDNQKEEWKKMNLLYRPETNIMLGLWNADLNQNREDYTSLKERYSIVKYGKYVLKTEPIFIDDFSTSKLVFIKDPDCWRFIQSSMDEYAFSRLFLLEDKESGIIDFTIKDCNIKDVYILEGWTHDYEHKRKTKI